MNKKVVTDYSHPETVCEVAIPVGRAQPGIIMRRSFILFIFPGSLMAREKNQCISFYYKHRNPRIEYYYCWYFLHPYQLSLEI